MNVVTVAILVILAIVLLYGASSYIPGLDLQPLPQQTDDPCLGVVCADHCDGDILFHSGQCILGSCGYVNEPCPFGCSDSRCLPESDTSNETNATNQTELPPNQLPIVSFMMTPYQGLTPLEVDILALCIDPDGNVTSCTIDFDDGSTFALDPPDLPYEGKHNYTEEGVFEPSLTAVDDRNGTATSESFFIIVNANESSS